MAQVSFERASCTYPGAVRPAVDRLDLVVEDGELLALVGPSGSGKSTVLRMLAGLEPVSAGRVQVDGVDVSEQPPGERDVAMVFQNYALYPHMSVAENLGFSLKLARVPAAERERRVREAARLLDLEALLSRKPKTLSGGQRQRVAMGRAIVREPQVFLFDEPLSNLDAKLRAQTRLEIQKLHAEFGVTSLFVTHDQVEAMTLAQRMIVMNAGIIEQIGTPEEVYEHPATPFVHHFLGHVNVFHGCVENSTLDFGAFSLALPLRGLPEATSAVAYARPHLLELDHRPTEPPQFRAIIGAINTAGPLVKVELASKTGTVVHVEVSQERYRQLKLRKGAEVFVKVKNMRVFPQSSGCSLLPQKSG